MAVDTTTNTNRTNQRLKDEAKNAFFKTLLTFGAILLVGVAFWVIVEVFIIETRPGLPAEIVVASRRIDPTLNTGMLDVMESRIYFSDAELAFFPIFLVQDSAAAGGATTGTINIFEMPFENPRRVTERLDDYYYLWLASLENEESELEFLAEENPLNLDDLLVEDATAPAELVVD
ncbi:MAG: hypothetical protein LBG64_04605 [Pseudomonadales bacterium]|jgi:hypothetical protein|nr:hypothetical protein [Pseudomonadales bacterium]